MALTKNSEKNKTNQKFKSSIICIHCHKKITAAKIKGFSLVCPYCDRPSDALFDLE